MKQDREARRIGRPTTKFNRDGGGWSTPEAPMGVQGEARPRGRPDIDDTMTYLEAGSRRRPDEMQPGSPSEREAHNKDQPGRGGRSTPEAPMNVQGKPVHAGGPASTIQRHAWKPVSARKPNAKGT